MYKKILFLSIITILFFANILFAQTTTDITLKPGFNFISFTNLITLNPSELKALNTSIEDVFLFSSSAGSFLSASEGTLSTLSAGKGYIIKSNATSDIKISITGNALTSLTPLNLKTGFNLVGFSQTPATFTFVKLMTDNSIIKGCYKWSPTAGTFIQVIRNETGIITKIDGVDPTIKAGESYFLNLYADSALTYDNTSIVLNPATYNTPVTPISKVANPVITPNSGIFTSSQLITISCATEGASIYYTIDSDSATLYSAPFSISKTCTIKATASKPGLNNADLVTATFSFTVNPELEITGSLPASALAAPQSNINYAAALGTKGCSISVVRSDAENTEIGTVSINSNSYKANIPITDNNYTALIIIKDNLGRVLFRNMLGKAITKSEIPASATKIIIPNINIDATSTAMALLAKEKNVEVSKITSVTATDFQNGIATKTSSISAEISQHFSSSPTLISEVAKAVNTVSTTSLSANVSTTTVPTNISTATDLLSSFVKVIKDPTLQTIITQNQLATSITLSAEQKIDSTTTTIDPILKVDQPILSHNGNTFPFIQEIKMSCNTVGASIHYTLDGTTPSTSSLKYIEPIIINNTSTIKAIAVKSGMKNSTIISESFTKSSQVPTISNAKAIEQTNGDVIVTWTTSFPIDINAKVIIRPFTYPSPSDPSELESQVKYSTAHSLTFPASKVTQKYSSLLISYIVGEDGTFAELEIENHKYVATPIINGTDNFSVSQDVTISSVTKDSTIYFSLDGTPPSSSSIKYSAPIKITDTTTIKAIAVKTNLNNSDICSTKLNKKSEIDIAEYYPIRSSDSLFYSNGDISYESKYLGDYIVAGLNSKKIGNSNIYSYACINENGFFICGNQNFLYDKPVKICNKFPQINEISESIVTLNNKMYKFSSTFLGNETITVTAGTYDAIKFQVIMYDYTTNTIAERYHLYFAKNIGLICQKYKGYSEKILIKGYSNGQYIAPKKKKWTFVFYFALNNTGTQDRSAIMWQKMIESFRYTDFAKYANLIIEFNSLTPLSNGSYSSRIYLSENTYNLEWSSSYLSIPNTGLEGNIINFYKWAIETYPAEHYALFINAHGSGTFSTDNASIINYTAPKASRAIGYDNYYNDSLNLLELKRVYGEISNLLNGQKIDIVCYDSCVMGMFEVGYQIKDYVNLFVASEASAYTMDMSIFINKYKSLITSNQYPTPSDVAKSIVDSYFDDPSLYANSITMSVMDLQNIKTIASYINDLAYYIGTGTVQDADNFFSAVLTSYNDQRFYGNIYIDLYDLCDLITLKFVQGSSIHIVASTIKNSLNSLIVYSKTRGTAYPYAHGVSIVFPKMSSDWKVYNHNQYNKIDFGYNSNWSLLIKMWTEYLYKIGY